MAGERCPVAALLQHCMHEQSRRDDVHACVRAAQDAIAIAIDLSNVLCAIAGLIKIA